MPPTLTEVVVSQMYTIAQILSTVHLKWVHITVCKLYFNKMNFKSLKKGLTNIGNF